MPPVVRLDDTFSTSGTPIRVLQARLAKELAKAGKPAQKKRAGKYIYLCLLAKLSPLWVSFPLF